MSGPAKVNKKEYLTNVKITKKYDVSAATVSRWMRLAREGKNNLQVLETDNRFLVRDSEHNHAELKRLTNRGRKHRGATSFKKIDPDKSFYEAFNHQQKYELIRSLMVDSEVPFKFTRLGEGARIWTNLQNKSIRDKSINAGSIDTEMLLSSIDSITSGLEHGTNINILEIGLSDFLSGPSLINRVSENFNIKNYISIFYSSEILDIQKNIFQKNINNYDEINFEQKVVDIERLILDEITVKLKQEDSKSVNIILLLGASLFNYKDYYSILHNLKKALFPDDYLIISNTIINDEAKAKNRSIGSSAGNRLLTWIPQSLGFEIGLNNLQFHFNDINNTKNVLFIPGKEYDIEFDTGQSVKIKKDQKIILVRQYLSDPLDFHHLMRDQGFYMCNSRINYNLNWFQSVFTAIGSNYF